MPVHDWTKVGPGIFHHFHHTWISELTRALNAGLLPGDYYALAEQITGAFGPDVLTLEAAQNEREPKRESGGGVAVAAAPPKVHFHARAELDQYAAKAKAVVIRHASNHRVIAMVEIVSPGNKSSRPALRSFVEKAEELIRAGVHLLIVDLFPPAMLDRNGIQNAIWERFGEERFVGLAGHPLTLAAYVAGPCPEAFVEPVGVNEALPDMPLFLTTDWYVPVPLERTYLLAFEAMPSIWRQPLAASATGAG
jgi:hypothetical protein